jgi:branched-chain amino acid transport system permease protein
MMELLYKIFIDPFVQMGTAPDLLVQTLWEGLVGGVLYALIALGFVLIFKASGVFNFAQGIMVVFAALTLVGLNQSGIPRGLSLLVVLTGAALAAWWLYRRYAPHAAARSERLQDPRWKWLIGVGVALFGVVAWFHFQRSVPAFVALAITVGVMFVLAVAIEKLVLRPLVNQPDIILFMATFGLTYFLIGLGELVFGGNPKVMIAGELGLPKGSYDIKMLGGFVSFQKIDIAAAVIATIMVATLAVFFQKTRIGRALRAVADSHKAALSVGISLEQIWVIVWFAAGIVALATGIMWGARSDVSFALQIIALKALPVLILGGFTSIPGAIVGGVIIGVGEKLGEFYWGPLLGSGIESWLAYAIALVFLLFRPQGLFGEKIIERI